jgi:hypothetical protein
MSYVYFILDEVSNAVKIGKANDVHNRLGELQVGNPNPLKIIHYINCVNERDSLIQEKIFHTKFDSFHMRGEWFRFDLSCFREFIIESVKPSKKQKRDPLIVNTLFGPEYKFGIADRPYCFFYPYLTVQILDNYESSDKRKIPYRTMVFPTDGESLLMPYSPETNRVFISSKKHNENMKLKNFLEQKYKESKSVMEFLL